MKKQENIRVLVATGLYPPDIGGPATYSRMLEEKLPAHGVNVVVIPFGIVRHLPKVVRHVVFAWKLFIASKDVDCIYALDPISVGVPSLLVSKLRGKPFLVRLGGDYAWEQGQQRFGLTLTLDEYTHNPKDIPLLVKLLAYIQTAVVDRAQLVIAPSEYLKNIIATWGIESKRITVMYSALFPLQVGDNKVSLREQLSYSGTVITSVGRLVPWKGFVELIDVFSELTKRYTDISLIIVGDGPQHDVLQEKIVKLGLQNKVRLLGRLGKEALGAAIKASDIFVLNTSYEGLSHQLLEVMELSVPIITTHVGGNPELIQDGVSGILVPIKNNDELFRALIRMIENESLRTLMVQGGRVRIIDFNQDAVVVRFAELIQREVVIDTI